MLNAKRQLLVALMALIGRVLASPGREGSAGIVGAARLLAADAAAWLPEGALLLVLLV